MAQVFKKEFKDGQYRVKIKVLSPKNSNTVTVKGFLKAKKRGGWDNIVSKEEVVYPHDDTQTAVDGMAETLESSAESHYEKEKELESLDSPWRKK